jgi:hypothetical protein
MKYAIGAGCSIEELATRVALKVALRRTGKERYVGLCPFIWGVEVKEILSCPDLW